MPAFLCLWSYDNSDSPILKETKADRPLTMLAEEDSKLPSTIQ